MFFLFEGLDPASYSFKYVDDAVALSPDDAEFVDVIHTDDCEWSNIQSIIYCHYYYLPVIENHTTEYCLNVN